MVIIVSSKNGCTYTLDPVHNAVLYYHPLNSDGSYETAFSSYAEVEWDELDEENVIEADRCVKMLKAEIELSGTDQKGGRLKRPYSMSNTYDEILKIWNYETPDDFAIFSELYYEMFGGEEEIPYTTSSTCSSFFPYD